MSGRGALAGVTAPHQLATGLPGIFRPVLSREEAALLRALAHRDAGEDEAVLQRLAHERLGLPPESTLADPTARAAEDAARAVDAAARAAEDDFLWRWCAGLDELLVPVQLTLDTLETFVDPRLTPTDFLGWLASWVALADRTDWPESGWRTLIGEAAELYRRRATPWALKRVVELYAQAQVGLRESGGCVDGPDGVPLDAPASLVVRVAGARRPHTDVAFARGVEAVVVAAKPVHVPHRIEWA